MEEDELGTQREIGHTTDYIACSRCGKLARREEMAVTPGDALEDLSEFQ
jgi:hypothetical protein